MYYFSNGEPSKTSNADVMIFKDILTCLGYSFKRSGELGCGSLHGGVLWFFFDELMEKP